VLHTCPLQAQGVLSPNQQEEEEGMKSSRMVVTQEIGHKHLNFTFFTGPGVQLLSDAVEHCNGSFEESPVKSHLHNTIHYLFSLSIFSKTCVWHMFLIVEYDLCLFTLLKTLDYCQTLLKINISNCFHVLSSPPLSTQV